VITKLTEEQKAGLEKIRQKWTSLGLTTDQPAVKESVEIAQRFLRAFNISIAHLSLVCSSPISCWIAAHLEDQMHEMHGGKIPTPSGNARTNKEFISTVDYIVEQCQAQLSFTKKETEALKKYALGMQISDFIWPYIDGHWCASYFSYIESMRYIGATGLETEQINSYMATHKIGLLYPLEKLLIIGKPPVSISLDNNFRLHADGRMAIKYEDGFGLFMLHGIAMTPEQVLTPAEKLDPTDVLRESNVDRRRELIRKVGVELMLAKLPHKTLDKQGDYELLSIDLPSIANDIRYLKMLNPSIGVWHLEGVDTRECPDPRIDSVLNWRNKKWYPHAEILT
jgi:hypothetical protein